MSPEVFFHKPYSYAADIWSFGCTIFEVYTKLKPYGRSLVPNLAKLHSKEITPLSFHGEEINHISDDLKSFL